MPNKLFKLFLIILAAFLCFFSRVYSKPLGVAQNTIDFASNLSYDMDPDRDGDAKGYNYFPKHRVGTGRKVFIFDPNYGAWAFYDENGDRLNVGKASGGKLYCPDVGRRCKTVAGRFSVISKGGSGCRSTRYPRPRGGAPMPYCMRFHPKGYAVHGSYEIPDYNASHGCIRITPTAARWLNHNYVTIGTTVIVLPYETGMKNAIMLGFAEPQQNWENWDLIENARAEF